MAPGALWSTTSLNDEHVDHVGQPDGLSALQLMVNRSSALDADTISAMYYVSEKY